MNFNVTLPAAFIAHCRKEGANPRDVLDLILDEYDRASACLLLKEGLSPQNTAAALSASRPKGGRN